MMRSQEIMKTQKHFEIKHQKDDDIQILHISGHFDGVSSGTAEQTILETIEKADKIVFKLDELIYISSAGLRIILVAAKKGRNKKARIVFCSLGENVRKIFEISNFHTILDIVENLDCALKKLKS
jgi:anti-anti-sigma factor